MSGAPGRHPSLTRAGADLIGGEWVELVPAGSGGAGGLITSRNPAHPDRVVWSGQSRPDHVPAAVQAARHALPAWASAPAEKRFAVLRRFAQVCKARAGEMADLICDETGKVLWEARAEAGLLSSKVDITLDQTEVGGVGGLRRVAGYELKLADTRAGRCWFRPHGVMAVIGPFNFPAHLPNGHIVPALAMGNTVVFKPSDKAPGVGQLLGELFQEALEAEGWRDAGIMNVVQGGADIAARLVTDDGIDGILFTGSWPVGRKILEANLDRPGRIVALEMGGNNAAVVMPDADLRQVAIEIVRCAFNTTGQRCTCTRRVVLHEAVAARLIPAICKAAASLIVGDPRAGHPVFMGPIISEAARASVLRTQAEWARRAGDVLVESSAMEGPEGSETAGGWYVTPGVMRVDRFAPDEQGGAGCDVEVFGPLLRLCVVRSADEAIEQCNATRYGLVASIFTHDETLIRRFLFEARAGCINVNTGTAGASSKLPFGGLGLSGNHRPAGSFSPDYCAYPVAGMIETGPAATIAEGMRFEDAWLR